MIRNTEIEALLQRTILNAPISFERFASFQLQSSWDDVAAKAKRLIQSGQVTVLRNSPTHVMGHVVGDHGEYNNEIARTDPNSNVIEEWNCECPWNQYAFDRTRKWKYLEGRVCVLPGSQITMADGSYKNIEEVQYGDKVLTHDGIGIVRETMITPHDGLIYAIYRTGYPDPLRLTGNHEVWALSLPSKVRLAGELSARQGQGFKISNTKFLDLGPEWIDAADLRRHDWIASTWLEEESIVPIEGLPTVLGYYLAEGNTAQKSRNGDHLQVQWTFNIEEGALVDDLGSALRQMNIESKLVRYPRGNSLSARISDRTLAAELERLGGRYARHKELAPEVLLWNCAALEELLRAYHAGDGTINRDGRYTFYTASSKLARQLFDILVKCGYVPSWSHAINNGGPNNREGRTSIERIQYVPRARQFNGRRRFEDFYLSKVTKIDLEHYVGPVYNLSVDDQESYVVEGIVAHNCSHVLGLYWKAKSTPLDMSDEDMGFQAPRGQMPGATPGQQQIPNQEPVDLQHPNAPRTFSPEEQAAPTSPTPQALPSTQNLVQGQPPQMPFNAPQTPQQPQLQQLQLFDITAPPGMQPVPQGAPVSVPGGRPATPGNPVTFPGTFSHFIPIFTIRSSGFVYASDDLNDYFEDQRGQGLPIYAALTQPVTLEMRGGKIPMPDAQSMGVSSEGVPMYRVLDLGYNPETGERENASVNALMGAPELTGTYTDAPVGKHAEILDYNPQLKMAYVTIPLNYPGGEDCRLHPHQLAGWVDYKSLRALPQRTRSVVRRKRF
jgi:hypothetical protein